MAFVPSAVAAMFGAYMAFVFQVEQCPVVVVGTQVYAASVTSVASVGASVWVVFHVAQVHRAASAFSGAAIYFYVIYEIGFCHILMDNIINILQRY